MPDPETVAAPPSRRPLSSRGDSPGATPRPSGIRASAVLTPVVEHWLAIMLTGFVLGALVIGMIVRSPRKYVAAVTVAPVGNARTLNLPGGLASSLLGGSGGGVQATPIFVARLSRLRNVLDAVALEHVSGDSTRTVIERLMNQPLASILPYRYSVELDQVIRTSVDRESGTLTLQTALPDSALARTIVNALIAQVRAAYTRTTKSQATELREAQVTRVDSALRQLRRAEGALVSFTSANRVVPDYSPIWVERQRLQSNMQVAQSVYTQAITEIQTARGKELEDAPALVILDPVPGMLTPASRGTVKWGLFAFILGALVALVYVVVREAAATTYARGGGDVRRLVDALARLPLIGGRPLRWYLRA